LKEDGGPGSAFKMAAMVSGAVSPSNARRPDNISYNTHPKANGANERRRH
jgi:hypothetical protein